MSVEGNGLRRRCVVVISAEAADGTPIKQVVDVECDAGTPDGAVLGQGLAVIRQTGGIITDGPGGSIEFHPVGQFKKVSITVNKVVQAVIGVTH